MHIAFLAHTVPGHIYPMTTLARELQRRGHDVTLLSVPDGAPYAAAAGLQHMAFGADLLPAGTARVNQAVQSKLQGEAATAFSIGKMQEVLTAIYRDLPGILKETHFDGLVLDPLHIGAGSIPAVLGVPYAHTYLAMHFDMTGATPFCTFDWPHEETPEAVERNRAGIAHLSQLLQPFYDRAMEFGKAHGVHFDFSDPFATLSPLAMITQVPGAFDFPSTSWPPQFRHTGPFSDGKGRLGHPFPWDQLNGKPILYASLGTLQNGMKHVFETIGRVAAQLPDYQLVVSLGSVLSRESIDTFPADAIIIEHGPQAAILSRASLCITHAGLNTVLEALTEGVPLVAIPITNDQPGVASRIAYHGVGTVVPVQKLTDDALLRAALDVLTQPQFRLAAQHMQTEIHKANGLSNAADLLESAFRKHSLAEHDEDDSTPATI